METRRDDFDLTAELRALRPPPSSAFADELDARVAAGFARTDGSEEAFLGRIARAMRNSSPRRLALPAGALALTALVVATAVVAIGQSGNPRQQVVEVDRDTGGGRLQPSGDHQFSGAPVTATRRPPTGKESAPGESSLSAGGAAAGPSTGFQSSGPTSKYQTSAAEPTAGRSAVERDAELVLHTQPGQIGKASRQVFDAVHAANGVVLSSSVRDQGSESSARFQLLVPSVQLGATLASLSQIAEVRSRHESTLDITAPTVSVGDRLKDSEATIEGMLTQLGAAESYEERALLERQLRQERQRAAVLRSQLDQLRRRADFARISLRIEGGSDAGAAVSGRWGVDDALDDAGRILAIAAGVTVVGLAVLGPLALIALLAWLVGRTWRRQRRERALG